MFAHAPPATGKVADWLRYLKAVHPSSRAGELMHKSLLEDGNVCDEYGEQTRQFIESQPAAVESQDAQGTYQRMLSHLEANGCRYCDPHNDRNRLSAAAFGRFARVVSAEGFAQYNLTPQVKTNRRSQRRGVGAKLAANRLSAIGNDTRRLVGQIGSDPAFAARSESVQPHVDGSFDAQENPQSSGAGRRPAVPSRNLAGGDAIPRSASAARDLLPAHGTGCRMVSRLPAQPAGTTGARLDAAPPDRRTGL